jgi:phosphoesterase RecJ-like protein
MPAIPATCDDVIRSIRQAKRVVITAHARPDGDAVGSVLAAKMLLDQMGAHAEIVLSDPVPHIYRSLPCSAQIHHRSHAGSGYDTAILLECDSLERARLAGLENLFLINIDHHVSGRPFADVNWIDTGASAVAEMIYRLVLAAGARVTREMAACLYTAVLTDTGSFCYEGTGAHTFDLAAALIRCGAQPELVARDVYFSNPLAKMLLLGRALSNLQIDGNLSWLWVTREDMKSTGAEGEDCEGVVNYAIGIEGVQAAVFLRELEEGQIRLSLRSKGRMNVAKIAERFGGGGHENASGCTLPGPLAAAAERILAELRSEIPARRQPGC